MTVNNISKIHEGGWKMPRIEVPTRWAERIKVSHNINMLSVELDGIERVLEIHKDFPHRSDYEILVLKKQRFILNTKIRLLIENGVSANGN
jgi:hypothetical protein